EGVTTQKIGVHIHQTSLNFIGLHRNSSDFIGIHRTSPEFIGLHWNLLDFIGLHRTSPNFIRLLTECTLEFKSGYPLAPTYNT
ncbi:hypothetical protein ALC57_16889, partial [Trachymyrmex cornetzi]